MTLDELLVEWSYRTKKGYPDLGNPSDILILKGILTELDLPTDVLNTLGEEDKNVDVNIDCDDIDEEEYANALRKLHPNFDEEQIEDLTWEECVEILEAEY